MALFLVGAAALGAGCASLQPTVSPQGDRTTIGAIRWDAWFADTVNPYERNLADRRWHGRLPFYARIIAGTGVEVRGDTQDAVDREIAYARAGGIDYWAFLYYSPGIRADGFNHDHMNRARRLYLSSRRKRDVGFCLIVGPKHPDAEIGEFVEMMQEPSYQKVADGRPLLYIMYWDPTHTPEAWFGSTEACRAYMDALRARAVAKGLGNPYCVALTQEPEILAAAAPAAGIDAIGAYTSWGGPDYAGLCAAQVRYWDRMRGTGCSVVPNVSAGWGGPRDGLGDTLQPTPGQLAGHVRSAFGWIAANPAAAEAGTMLIYAWNEVDEGGWLVPDQGQGTARLDAIRRVVDAMRHAK
jgi:hypothetical protein